ncbi:MAG: transposase [Candidatus Margulisbacteria bacterium]|nr:transposase [Candidatus Margulisiibacteriota bacterium]
MNNKHRNSQRRIYAENGIYFITTKTYKSIKYFEEDIFCDLLVEEIKFCRELMGFKIFGFKINPDHLHLLLQPAREYNYSKIMHFIKRNFSQNANKIIGHTQKGIGVPHRRRGCASPPSSEYVGVDAIVEKLRKKYLGKYGHDHKSIPFAWQASYHDHLIRGKKDFIAHLHYLNNQWIKHGLKENKYCFFGALPW